LKKIFYQNAFVGTSMERYDTFILVRFARLGSYLSFELSDVLRAMRSNLL
jgi:hypothetical protein